MALMISLVFIYDMYRDLARALLVRSSDQANVDNSV